jgi:SnoaL-like domain
VLKCVKLAKIIYANRQTSPDGAAMDPRLATLIAKDAIRDLVMAYARAADRKDTALMRRLYHADAVEDHGSFFQGLARDFIDRLPEIQAPIDILSHHVTSHSIVVDGDRAEGEVYVLAMHRVQRGAGDAVTGHHSGDAVAGHHSGDAAFDVLVGGRYLDGYECRDGAWKFSHRAIVADWAHVWDPSIIALDHAMVAGSLIGQAGPEDPSYRLLGLLPRGG